MKKFIMRLCSILFLVIAILLVYALAMLTHYNVMDISTKDEIIIYGGSVFSIIMSIYLAHKYFK